MIAAIRGPCQAGPSAPCGAAAAFVRYLQQPGSWRTSRSGRTTCASVVPSCPSCPPGSRPVFFRGDCRGATTC